MYLKNLLSNEVTNIPSAIKGRPVSFMYLQMVKGFTDTILDAPKSNTKGNYNSANSFFRHRL